MQLDTKAVWSDSVGAEIGFWDRTIKQDRGAFQWRYRRPVSANQLLPGFVKLFTSERVALLDVGSGPAPVVIGKYSKPVDITGCDPLADEYQALLERHGIKSPVALIPVEGERLVERFGKNCFDIVHIQNALDHSYRPVEVVMNMVHCAKPGGLILIRTVINEGQNENYHGLHQWDISPGAGDFYIRHQDGATTAMRAVLDDEVELLLLGTHSSFHGATLQDWMDVVLVKKGAPNEFIKGVETEFFNVQIELGRMLAKGPARHNEELRLLRKEIARLRRQKAMVEQSTSYQLGRALTQAGRAPTTLGTLPREFVRLFQQSKQRRANRTHTFTRLQTKGRQVTARSLTEPHAGETTAGRGGDGARRVPK
jgi:SAM-dependent methyltransferase